MSCDHWTQAILEGSRADGLEAHLASCPDCAALLAGHRGALKLGGLVPRSARRVSRVVLVAQVAVMASVVLVAAGFGASRLLMTPHVSPRPVGLSPRVEGPLVVVAVDDDQASWHAMVALRDVVAVETHREPGVDDVTLSAFGALPTWVAPTPSHPLRGLGRALTPLVSPEE